MKEGIDRVSIDVLSQAQNERYFPTSTGDVAVLRELMRLSLVRIKGKTEAEGWPLYEVTRTGQEVLRKAGYHVKGDGE